ncbi:hypothetical protein [uncultured Methylobacterium sp.]|uniref:hypothetical protein n=1 Tax=uncultured Methylobacterium sp. TaxID=157278 RepID=UPI0035C9D6B7
MGDGSGVEEGVRSSGTLAWAIRTAGIAGFVGLAMTQYLAHGHTDASDPMRVAKSVTDPDTTGSIARGARSVRLDPCGTGSGSRPARP